MKINIFTDSKSTGQLFSKLEKSNEYHLEFYPCSDLKMKLKNINPGTIVYYDIGSHDAASAKKIISQLSSPEKFLSCIIDPKGTVTDIAGLFHKGYSDYIGKNLAKEPITPKRIQEAIEYTSARLNNIKDIISTSNDKNNYILSGSSWKDIKPGKEYTFCLMFVELDSQRELKNKFDGSHLNNIMKKFHDYLDEQASTINGKIWMWMDFGGLVLFPFDGKNCEAILMAFRLMLDRQIISAEEIGYDLAISYRIALHLGNTVYQKRGDTGNIISDSINSIYHLGQKFANSGNLYLTENLERFIPAGLENYFLKEGEYEGRKILRMKRPVNK